MPIPATPTPAPSVPVTSHDGSLQVTIDPTTASVLIRVNPTVSTNPNPTDRTRPYYVYVTRTPSMGGYDPTVRGLNGRAAPSGVMAGIDHEAPLGVPVTYQASWYPLDDSSPLGFSDKITLTIPATAAWLKSLRTPALSVPLNVRRYPDWTYDVPSTISYPLGAAAAQGWGDVRHLGSGSTLQLITRDRASLDALTALLAADGIGPYLLQPSKVSQEPDVYVLAQKAQPVRMFDPTQLQQRVTSIDVVQTAYPPTQDWRVRLPGRSYAQIGAKYPTHGSVPNVPTVDIS